MIPNPVACEVEIGMRGYAQGFAKHNSPSVKFDGKEVSLRPQAGEADVLMLSPGFRNGDTAMSVIGSLINVSVRTVGFLSALVLAIFASALTMSKRRREWLDRHRQRVAYWGYE